MIAYDADYWGVGFCFRIQGSVFPKALAWAMPSAMLSVVCAVFFFDELAMGPGVENMWSGFTSVLGFLLTFRSNQAYARFWEGAALISQVRGEWLNAVSSLMAFCSSSEEQQQSVFKFQHLLVRLMSMLHCSALQQVASVTDDCFEIISPEGIDPERLKFLCQSTDRCEVLLQWIQRLIVEANTRKDLDIPPPILSRVFQELSRGIVNLHNARKVKEIPFPFPYAQMITVMLLIHWVATPIIASQVVGGHPVWTALLTFGVVITFWSMQYIALEIEQPFGEDWNDLPVGDMQQDLNESLRNLLEKDVQTPPTFQFCSKRHTDLKTSRSETTFLGSGRQSVGKATIMDEKWMVTEVGAHVVGAIGRLGKLGSRTLNTSASSDRNSITSGSDATSSGGRPRRGSTDSTNSCKMADVERHSSLGKDGKEHLFSVVRGPMRAVEEVDIETRMSDPTSSKSEVVIETVASGGRGNSPRFADDMGPTKSGTFKSHVHVVAGATAAPKPKMKKSRSFKPVNPSAFTMGKLFEVDSTNSQASPEPSLNQTPSGGTSNGELAMPVAAKANAFLKVSTCPNDHDLQPYITAGGHCQGCKQWVERGRPVHDCCDCRWWVCPDCFDEQAGSPRVEGPPLSFRKDGFLSPIRRGVSPAPAASSTMQGL